MPLFLNQVELIPITPATLLKAIYILFKHFIAVAGLLPTAYKAKTQYLSAGGSMSISGVGGIMQIRNIYNSSGWDVWFCTEGKATRIATALYTTAVSVTMSGTTATIKNDNDGQRQIEVVYQTLL